MIKHCEFCGKEFIATTKHEQRKRFCNTSCSAKWRINKYGVTKMSDDARQKMSEQMKAMWTPEFRERNRIRMTTNNPVYQEGVIDKAKATRMKNGGYTNNLTGFCGNGTISKVERLAYDIVVPLGFEYNYAIGTKELRHAFPERHFARNYKPDFYNAKYKIAIEIDGRTHNSTRAKEMDAKKNEFYKYYGITVYRFTNEFVENKTELFRKRVEEIWQNLYQKN